MDRPESLGRTGLLVAQITGFKAFVSGCLTIERFTYYTFQGQRSIHKSTRFLMKCRNECVIHTFLESDPGRRTGKE